MIATTSSSLRVTIACVALTVLAATPSLFANVPQQQSAVVQTKLATIPIEIDSENYVFIKARVNGSEPLTFLLDSGAGSGLILYFKAAESLRLTLQGKGKASGGGESTFDTSLIKGATLSLGGVEITNQNFVVFPPDRARPASDRVVDGVIGYALFSRYVVEVDYQARVVNLYEPKTYQYTGSGQTIPIKVQGNVPFAQIELPIAGRKALEGEFIVDMGAGRFTVILNTPVMESRNLLAVAQKTIEELGAQGVGGSVKLLVGRWPEIRLGRFTFTSALIYFAQDQKGIFASSEFSGIMGGELLRRFKVIFDYAHKRMYVEPNSDLATPFEYDMSGIRVQTQNEDLKSFRVKRVAQNSPAFEAGVRVDDLILAVDGKPAAELTLTKINSMFQQEGVKHVLEIMSGGERKTIKFTLRRLI